MQMFNSTQKIPSAMGFPQNTCNHYDEQQTLRWRQCLEAEKISKRQPTKHEFSQRFIEWSNTDEGQLKIESWTEEMNSVAKYRNNEKCDQRCFEALYFLHEKLDYEQAFMLFLDIFEIANDKFSYNELVKLCGQGFGISQATVERAWKFFIVNPVAWSPDSATNVSSITFILAKQLYELHQCDGKLIQFTNAMRSIFLWSNINAPENELAKNELINYWSDILISAFDHDPDARRLFLDYDAYSSLFIAHDKFKSCFKKIADECNDARCAYEYAICVFNEENQNPQLNSDYYEYLMIAAVRGDERAQQRVIAIKQCLEGAMGAI